MHTFQTFNGKIYFIYFLFLTLSTQVFGQNGKEFLEWLKEYSPTGYFIIDDYETKDNEHGFHKQFITNKNAPLPTVAVHETGHMWNWVFGGKGLDNAHGYYIGNLKGYKVPKSFTPFNSKKIGPDIPQNLRTKITKLYILEGINGVETGSMVWGIYGILDEYSMYITGLKANMEMAACLKKHFNEKKNWDEMMNDVNTVVQGSPEFQYFILRYILYAKKSEKAIYNIMLKDKALREAYTCLRNFNHTTIEEWKLLCKEHGVSTETGHGWDWHKKFKAELEKQEYKDLEKIFLLQPTDIDKSPNVINLAHKKARILTGNDITFDLYSLQGKKIHSTYYHSFKTLSANTYTSLVDNLTKKYGVSQYILRMQSGNQRYSEKIQKISSFSP